VDSYVFFDSLAMASIHGDCLSLPSGLLSIQVSPPKPCTHLSSPPPPIRATCPAHLILLDLITALHLMSSTDHKAPRYVVFSTPCNLVPLRPQYSPQHPILEHPQPTFLPQCARPSFTPIQNNKKNYSSVCLTGNVRET